MILEIKNYKEERIGAIALTENNIDGEIEIFNKDENTLVLDEDCYQFDDIFGTNDRKISIKIKEPKLFSDTNKIILENITGKEKFKIICRAKNIDNDGIERDIINKIEFSNIVDKDALIGKRELWDEDYIYVIKEYNVLYIDKTFLFNRQEAIKYFEVKDNEIEELWIELNEKEKELIKLALDCNVTEIECNIE